MNNFLLVSTWLAIFASIAIGFIYESAVAPVVVFSAIVLVNIIGGFYGTGDEDVIDNS